MILDNYINEKVSIDKQYGIPQEKKYPLYDKKHVLSAIKLFNWVDEKYEKQLANAILKKIDEYKITRDEIHITDKNRFYKYLNNK